MATLTPREYDVITRLYGIGMPEEMGCKEIALELGIDISRVSQAKMEGMQRLRR